MPNTVIQQIAGRLHQDILDLAAELVTLLLTHLQQELADHPAPAMPRRKPRLRTRPRMPDAPTPPPTEPPPILAPPDPEPEAIPLCPEPVIEAPPPVDELPPPPPPVIDDQSSVPASATDLPPKRARIRRRRTRPRSKTIPTRRGVRNDDSDDDTEFAEPARPTTRSDCEHGLNDERPCPWVACKYHLYLDVNPVTGSIKINFPDLEPWELPTSCCLDAAEHGGLTLDEVGDRMNLTRERIRQIEVRGLFTIKLSSPSDAELGTVPLEKPDVPKPRRRRAPRARPEDHDPPAQEGG